ncbi:hypothetical protein ACFL59_01125 [Planctomycetota bacterium]
MEARACIATAFYRTKGTSPNLRAFSNEMRIRSYYQCMVVFFATARRFCSNEALVLFANDPIPPKYKVHLDRVGVSVVVVPAHEIVYCSDSEITNQFPGCLFTLDVIRFFSRSQLHEEYASLLLFDSDCFFIDGLDDLIGSLVDNGQVAGIPLDGYGVNHCVNGQTRASLSLLLAGMSQESDVRLLRYYGGEFYGFASSLADVLSEEIGRCFAYVKSKVGVFGNTYTEEHIMSLVMNLRGDMLYAGSDRAIKRVWTADNYSNVDGTESSYSVLHLPAGKDKFFKNVFGRIEKAPLFLSEIPNNALRDLVMAHIESSAAPSIRRMLKNSIKGIAKRLLHLD